MRILHLATFLQGGAGRVIVDLALSQRAAGDDITVVTSETGVPGYGNYPAYLAELSAAGIGVAQVDSLFRRDYAQNLAVVRRLDELVPIGREPFQRSESWLPDGPGFVTLSVVDSTGRADRVTVFVE